MVSLVGCVLPRTVERRHGAARAAGGHAAQPAPGCRTTPPARSTSGLDEATARVEHRLRRLAAAEPDRAGRCRPHRLGRERLPARGGQPGVPPQPDRAAASASPPASCSATRARSSCCPAAASSATPASSATTRSIPGCGSTAPTSPRSACGWTTSPPTTCRTARPRASGPASATRPPRTSRPAAAPSGDPIQLAVNHPLRLDGNRVYLLGHGYAPRFTVTFPDGTQRTAEIQWSPVDPTTLLSQGATKFARPGRHRRGAAPHRPARGHRPARPDQLRRPGGHLGLPRAARPGGRGRRAARRPRPRRRSRPVHLQRRPVQGGLRRAGAGGAGQPGARARSSDSTTAPRCASTASRTGSTCR